MITPAGPAEEETARTGSETRPRLNGQRRRHHSARQSPAPPIASTTSSGPWSPCRSLLRPAAPNTAASRNRALSTIQSRRERRAGGGSSASGPVRLLRRRRRRVMPPSVGRVSAAEQPAEVDACTHFGRPGDSTCARLRVSGRPANRVIRDRTGHSEQENPMLTRVAHVTVRYRWAVIGCWLVLVVVGGFAAGEGATRWYQSFSIPGQSAYQAGQRTLGAFGAGVRPPSVVVFPTAGDATNSRAIAQAMRRAAATVPGSLSSSYFSTHNPAYVSRDRHTTFMELYPPGPGTLTTNSGAAAIRAAAASGLPAGITVDVTGHDPLEEASTHGSSGGSSVLVEALAGGLGALVILLFVFGTLPAVLIPLVVAAAAILNTFTLVWALTYVTSVSIVVQFLIALVGLGVAGDYALLIIFRFRAELRAGRDVEQALVQTVTHAGRSVIVSGSTVAVGLLSMLVLPVPVIRSVGLGGMLIPAVSVLAAITLLPALLAVLGERINSVRVLPERLADRGHPEDGAWGRWARVG